VHEWCVVCGNQIKLIGSNLERVCLAKSDTATVVLNMCWTQFINYANYKIIDSNLMDRVNVTKIHTSHLPNAIPSPWRACAVKRRFLDREWQAPLLFANKRSVKHVTRSNSPAVVSDSLFSELHIMRVFPFCFSQLISKVRPDKYYEWMSCFGILLASPSNNLLRIEWIAQEHVLISVFNEVQLVKYDRRRLDIWYDAPILNLFDATWIRLFL